MTYGVPNVKKFLVGQIKQLNIWILEKKSQINYLCIFRHLDTVPNSVSGEG